jgi:RHS repeat-associated protein
MNRTRKKGEILNWLAPPGRSDADCYAGLTGSASASQSWSPDALGNFTSVTTGGSTQTRSANDQNEITSASGATTPSYDADGNTTQHDTGLKYVWDAWGRMVTVKSSGGTTLETMTYDGLGRRVTDTASGTTTASYYDGEKVLEEWQSGQAVTQNVWSPVDPIALVLRDRDTNGDGTLDERLYALQDANEDVVALVNTSGSVVERYSYLPFGAMTVMNSSWSTISSSAYGWNYGFQDMRQDAVSCLSETVNRWYSTTEERWLSNDPTGYSAGDPNLVRFVSDAPTVAIDPLGLESKPKVVPGPVGSGPPINKEVIQGPGNLPIPRGSAICIGDNTDKTGDETTWSYMAGFRHQLQRNRGKFRIYEGNVRWGTVGENLLELSGKQVPALVLSGHAGAAEGGVATSKGFIDAKRLIELRDDMPKSFARLLAAINDALSPDAPIIIAACSQGAEGARSADCQLISDLLGRPVIANGEDVNNGNYGEGKWYKFTPNPPPK